MNKLSKAQQRVVDILREDPEAFVMRSCFWNHQEIRHPKMAGFDDVEFFALRTREALEQKGVLMECRSPYGLVLSEEYKN